jgi:hypothetical protein
MHATSLEPIGDKTLHDQHHGRQERTHLSGKAICDLFTLYALLKDTLKQDTGSLKLWPSESASKAGKRATSLEEEDNGYYDKEGDDEEAPFERPDRIKARSKGPFRERLTQAMRARNARNYQEGLPHSMHIGDKCLIRREGSQSEFLLPVVSFILTGQCQLQIASLF